MGYPDTFLEWFASEASDSRMTHSRRVVPVEQDSQDRKVAGMADVAPGRVGLVLKYRKDPTAVGWFLFMLLNFGKSRFAMKRIVRGP
jgi:hypothetical protein